MKLSDRNWKEFYLSELFTFENCKCQKVSGLKKGNTPYIGATNKNNGVMSYIEYNGKYLTKGNCIVFICDGVGSIGYNIYKKENFIGSTTLKIGRNEKLNKYIGLFMTTIMDKNRQLYNFGYKRNEQRLRNEKVYLPINSKMQPDYEFMEAYMKYLEQKKLRAYLDYLEK